MTDRDWFRNITWDPEIEAQFEAKLRKAGDKAQYLRIQAFSLAESQPAISLKLLDRYFALGDTFHIASAWSDRALAYQTLGEIENALDSLEAGLAQERIFPGHKTDSFAEYPYLVAINKCRSRYESALLVLRERSSDAAFPISKFKCHAAAALIYFDQHIIELAKSHARMALEASQLGHSGFSKHPSLGLVEGFHANTIQLLMSVLAA